MPLDNWYKIVPSVDSKALILFIVFYILLIKSNASIITLIPFVLLLIMIYSISSLSLRENIDEYNNSLKNIEDVINLK